MAELNRTRGFEWTQPHLQKIEDKKKELDEAVNKYVLSDSSVNKIKKELKVLEELELPKRSTGKSAGYDFMASEHVTIPSIWKQATKYIFNKVFSGGKEVEEKMFKPTLVSTGVKSYMPEDEFLALFNRSSNPMKRFLLMGNGVGVVDSDYYGNPDNDGHIMFQFINFGIKDVTIAPGEKIGQGIFQEFRKADKDNAEGERESGFGSTGK